VENASGIAMIALEQRGAFQPEQLEQLRASCFRAIDELRVAHDAVSEHAHRAEQLLTIVYGIADFLDEIDASLR
jgi:hypothetical protein